MATDYPLLTRQRVLAVAAESTTGTAESLDAGDATYNAMGATIRPEYTNTERMSQGTAGQLPSVPGPSSGRITFQGELYGSASASAPAPGWADTLLKASGFGNSGAVYSPVTGSTTYTSLTAAVYMDGLKKWIAGAVANWTLRGEYGRPAVFDWELLGVWQTPADVALLTPTYDTAIPPRVAGATFTIGGTAYKVGSFELSMGNTLYLREDITKASGYFAACIPNRKPTFRCSVEATVLATKDWYANHAAGTEQAISLAIGSASGNTITIAHPKAQLMEAPQDEDAGGTLKHTLSFQLNNNSAAGDNELTFTFS